MNQSFLLYRLQKIDTQVDKNLFRLQEIERILSSDEQLLQSEHALHEAQKKYQSSKITLNLKEDEVQTQRIKIETNEAALYSGRILNPKELRDLQNEVAALKRHISNLEDELLEAMVIFEETEKAFHKAEDDHRKNQKDFESKSQELIAEREILLKSNDRLITERTTFKSSVTLENMETYQKLRQTKKGIAVSFVSDKTCTICGELIPPALWQAARSPQQVVFCSTCGRILFAD